MSLRTTAAWTRQMPAYNAVPPRTTLQPVSASPAVAPDDAKSKKGVDWPLPVREYVQRAFDRANTIPSISNGDMQSKLKETISYYASLKALDTVEWHTYPLPQELLLEERRQVASLTSPTTLQNGMINGSHHAHVNDTNEPTNSTTPQSKKRKSQDAAELQSPQADAALPPWRKSNLASRMTFTDGLTNKRQKKNGLPDNSSKFDPAELEKRRQRFQLGNGSQTTPPWGSPRKEDDDMPTGPVVGTNQSLEKSYFRLTAPPKPETVRPQHVLEKSLAMLTKKWRTEKNYNYICNQFKSLRQDLTVQHLKNAFTVKVYENHARISLEKGDLGEYNQCQTQLKALYAQNLGGHPAEFTAYRILYLVYTCNKPDMNDMLAELTLADKNQPAIKHALGVRSSLALGNYHKFFRLYLEAQNMGGYLMDMFIERERLSALANISKGYQHVTLRFLTDELGFENDEACREFLESHGAQHIIEIKPGNEVRVKVREAIAHFESLRAAAFSKVDIKGQI